MLILALTGSIGMGKSTAAQMFRARGIAVHDSDAAVHEIYSGPDAAAIAARFPGVLRDGSVDRVLLGGNVLNDPAALRDLEAIVHPLVTARRDTFLARARASGKRCVLLDVPLLFETGGQSKASVIVVVSAAFAVQKQRVLVRSGMTEDRFQQILRRQMPDGDKRARAHAVIATDRGLAAADRQVGDLLRALASA